MKANRQIGSLHGWEDEDYDTNQRKLKELADKLGGKNRQGEAAKKDEEKVPTATTTVHDRPQRKRSESGGSKSRSESLDKMRKRASSSKKEGINQCRGKGSEEMDSR
jgi:hypothetical protein